MRAQWRDRLPEQERKLYRVRKDMKMRCLNPHTMDYPRYGGRGIEVCDAWRCSRPAFRDWALRNGYRPGLEIDRKDNNGLYAPWNCRFVTRKENMRNNHLLTFGGVTRCIAGGGGEHWHNRENALDAAYTLRHVGGGGPDAARETAQDDLTSKRNGGLFYG